MTKLDQSLTQVIMIYAHFYNIQNSTAVKEMVKVLEATKHANTSMNRFSQQLDDPLSKHFTTHNRGD